MFPALLGEVAAVEHPHRLRVSQPGGQILLQASHHCVIVPASLGEKALQCPCRDAHRFGKILSVAPLPSLHQQGLKIVPAAFPPLLAANGLGEEGMKLLKAVVDPLEVRRIHHPNHPSPSGHLSYQITRRCSTRELATRVAILSLPAILCFPMVCDLSM